MFCIEGWGTGLPRLFESCAEMGLPEPKFEEFGDGIKITVYRSIGDTRSGIDYTGIDIDRKFTEVVLYEN